MSKIKELLNDKQSVLVFDIDGVLATLEFGKYNHYYLVDDKEWNLVNARGLNFYKEDKVSHKMQEFLKDKDMSRVYVITTVGTNNESEYKKEFASKYYGIFPKNMYYVQKNSEKVDALKKIKELYLDLEDYHIIMIDDTVDILNDIMEKTNFSTVHISSFLDI